MKFLYPILPFVPFFLFLCRISNNLYIGGNKTKKWMKSQDWWIVTLDLESRIRVITFCYLFFTRFFFFFFFFKAAFYFNLFFSHLFLFVHLSSVSSSSDKSILRRNRINSTPYPPMAHVWPSRVYTPWNEAPGESAANGFFFFFFFLIL